MQMAMCLARGFLIEDLIFFSSSTPKTVNFYHSFHSIHFNPKTLGFLP